MTHKDLIDLLTRVSDQICSHNNLLGQMTTAHEQFRASQSANDELLGEVQAAIDTLTLELAEKRGLRFEDLPKIKSADEWISENIEVLAPDSKVVLPSMELHIVYAEDCRGRQSEPLGTRKFMQIMLDRFPNRHGRFNASTRGYRGLALREAVLQRIGHVMPHRDGSARR